VSFSNLEEIKNYLNKKMEKEGYDYRFGVDYNIIYCDNLDNEYGLILDISKEGIIIRFHEKPIFNSKNINEKECIEIKKINTYDELFEEIINVIVVYRL